MNIKQPTIEDKALLAKLDSKTLSILYKYLHDKDFPALIKLFGLIWNQEKSLFFEIREWEADKLSLQHKYSLGRIDGLATFFRLIFGSSDEIKKREVEREVKRKEKNAG